ncbi:DUF5689 domain-containing protein [Carboxylicivirga linearis]|uniref:Choice-of-anchor J domain-containing protein n=1 Tax=Carboxylicivirga linearis TaxID=1628157 RepID=A0ABS5JVQ6_9BACT|nr:DUF5689 domain-containing protein [Carboxylicivirga linearis]MBS2098908.1 choice-of-anchor J domain-containing protein [Carboxylicivirga linearis]
MKLFKLSFYFLLIAFVTFSCSEDPEAPSTPEGTKLTINQLRALYSGADISVSDDVYIEGTITFTPSQGNIPDFVAYIQDETAAITLTESGTDSFTEGSKIKVNCQGLTLTEYNGLLQFGSVDYTSMVEVLLPTGSEVTPTSVTIADLTDGSHQSELVQISNVQFSSVPGTFSGSQTLTDCTDNIAVYTRSASDFASDNLPEGNGTLVGIASYYNSAQILLRDPSELDMTGERCSGGGGGSGDGTGTKDDPYDVAYVLSSADDGSISGWVKGYIIGTIPATGEATLTAPFDVATNMLIAASADETNVENMVSVQLPSGSIRTALNLVDNESNLGKEVIVLGSLEWYYGFSGVKSLTGYWLDGAGIDPDNRTEDDPTPETDYPTGSFFFENFENTMDDMDIFITGWDNKAQTGERLWQGNNYSNNNYAQATAYNSSDDNNDIWLVTPSINIDGKTNPTFNCDLKGGYDNGAILEVYVLTDYDGSSNPWDATATKLDITLPSVPSSGYGDNFESSGDMDLSSFSGSIHIAFKYIGSTSQTTTWQIDNINCFEN